MITFIGKLFEVGLVQDPFPVDHQLLESAREVFPGMIMMVMIMIVMMITTCCSQPDKFFLDDDDDGIGGI